MNDLSNCLPAAWLRLNKHGLAMLRPLDSVPLLEDYDQ